MADCATDVARHRRRHPLHARRRLAAETNLRTTMNSQSRAFAGVVPWSSPHSSRSAGVQCPERRGGAGRRPPRARHCGQPTVAGQPFLVSVLVEAFRSRRGEFQLSRPSRCRLECLVSVGPVSLSPSCVKPAARPSPVGAASRGNISSAANPSFRAAQPAPTCSTPPSIEGGPTQTRQTTPPPTVTVGWAPTAAKPCIVPDVMRRTPGSWRAILRAGCRLGVTRKRCWRPCGRGS